MEIRYVEDFEILAVSGTSLSDGTPLIRKSQGCGIRLVVSEEEEPYPLDPQCRKESHLVLALGPDLAERFANDLLDAVRKLDTLTRE